MIADFKKTLKLLGFKPGKDKDCLQKAYSVGQSVTVNFAQQKIDYGNKIQVDDRSVTNFSQPENLVVLECVDRLLVKGYQPEHILLQKRWPLGRTGKSGIADIIVRGRDGQTLLIIECKTWGAEFDKEKARMNKDGGQLFSYFQQDKSAAFLCLYASGVEKEKIEWHNVLVDVRDREEHRKREDKNGKRFVYRNANDVPGLMEVWENRSEKIFLSSGIFERGIEAYSPGFEPIKIRDLSEFSDEDTGKVYGVFEEVLRHNNISDRSNAFNRVISLILAKIVDEDKKAGDTADFQILEGDIAETVQERLETLHSRAMRDYLKEEVVNHTESEIDEIVSHFPRQEAQKEIRKVMRELKFYKNNEFAFKEVYNERLFRENAKVLFEVVRLFAPYRFRYGRKAQFLGDFFELMLESGYKQTEGQFFTPTPIARFIVSSLPLRKIIEGKLRRGESDFLPYVVDYACGSGHFLTEAIEKIQSIIERDIAGIFAGLSDSRSGRLDANFADYEKSTRWAGDYIFGVEKDYRLARTSQVSCFMHGDGDANIVFGDGLIHYEKEEEGQRLPKRGFDVLVANPPYSIKDFRQHLRGVAEDDYELLRHIGASSDDIEVLFLERAAQLLQPDGVAGIFMPSSILANSGVYRHARELMLRYFEVTAIAEFGGETFAKTGTNTVILFLRRRENKYAENCRCIAEDFIRDGTPRPEDFADSESAYSTYAAHRGFDLADYKTFVARAPGEAILQSAFYKSLRETFESGKELKSLKSRVSFRQLSAGDRKREIDAAFFDWALVRETEKFFAYLLCHRLIDSDGGGRAFAPQQTLIIKSGATPAERKNFLGYSFSERRGYKGIELTTDENGKHITKLYDADDDDNSRKINAHIRRAFLRESVGAIDSELAENLRAIDLHSAIDFDAADFEFRINLQESKRQAVQSKWPLVKIGDVCITQSGGTPFRGTSRYFGGEIPWAKISDIEASGGVITETEELISDAGLQAIGGRIFPVGTVLLAMYASVGKVAVAGIDLATNQAILSLNSKDSKRFNNRYLFHWLENERERIAGFAHGTTQMNLTAGIVKNLLIPLPPINVQREIVAEFDTINSDAEKNRREIAHLQNQIGVIFNQVTQKTKKIQFGKIAELKYGKSLPASRRIPGEYPVMGSNGIDGYHSEYLIEGPAIIVGRKGSAGQVTFVDENCWPIDTTFYLAPDESKVNMEFAYHLLLSLNLESFAGGVGVPGLNRNDVYGLEVPLPSLAVQNKAAEKMRRLDEKIKATQTHIAQAQPKKKAVLESRL